LFYSKINLKTALRHIASIQTGIFARTVSDGDAAYLQAKHFDENGELNSVLHNDIKADEVTDKHLLKNGDVLFAAKGRKNFAAYYKEGKQPQAASTSFFVIRIHPSFRDKILPEFLAWFINNPSSQNILKSRAMGTSIVSISKAAAEELEISIPAIEIQKAILKIHSLRKLEMNIQKQMDVLKGQYVQQLLVNAIK